MPPSILKRGFTGISLTTNDLRTIAHWAAKAGTLEVRANGARLMSIDQVDQVIAEDVVLERFELSVLDRADDRLELVYDQASLLVRLDPGNPRLQAAFDALCDYLGSRPANHLGRCVVEVSAPGTWVAPATPARLRSLPARSGPGGAVPVPWWRRLPWFSRRRQPR